MKLALFFSRMRWGAASAGCLAAVLLAFGGNASAAGIADTKHNLGGGPGLGGRNQVAATDTQEICVFCHTPHGSVAGAPAPLWNKRLGTGGAPAGGGTGYTLYTTATSGSIEGAVAEVGGVSMACLSCHDGTQAMDNIINAPGSGGYDPLGGGNNGLGYTWSGSSVDGGVGGTGKLNSGVALLGVDLSNDHPIGIQYCGGGLSASGTGTCNDTDFRAPLNGTVNGAAVVWVETGGNSTKQRTDLPLYPGRGAATGPLVECATCHDPHVKAGELSGGVAAGDTFLRISNASSAVCTSCHVK